MARLGHPTKRNHCCSAFRMDIETHPALNEMIYRDMMNYSHKLHALPL